MGIFSAIRDKIFQHKAVPAPTSPRPDAPSGPVAPSAATSAAPASQAPPQPVEPVDVEAVLSSMAEIEGGGGNWRTSIVDLLKLLHMDSSLEARKALASELGVSAGEAGSAEQNIALHRAVMKKLAANGGRVPDSFYA
ncbi:MAG: DUF3597 domain-containing protein [Pseudomonadota bacterium]